MSLFNAVLWSVACVILAASDGPLSAVITCAAIGSAWLMVAELRKPR